MIKNTLGISLYQLFVGFPFPIMLAITLNQLKSKRFRGFVQTVSYAPHFISVVVIVGMLLVFLSPTSGLIGNVIKMFGGIATVDIQLYDADKVDSVNRWQKIRYIELPLLIPTIIILLILRAGGIMSIGFEKVFLMQNSLNIGVSEIIATYVYKIGLISSQYSCSAAIGFFNTLINFMLLCLVNYLAKKLGEISLW